MSIECFNLSKRYGSKVALSDVSLEIADGKITGLVGPNGAGKSTLIKLMTGLIYPTEGFVRIDGYDVHAEHRQAMQKLGAIVEWPNFYTDLTGRRNLAILSGGHGPAYEKKLKEVTRFLNIDYALDRKTGVLSTGMKQRLGIALALLPDSQYIILDEPANGLDPEGIVEIRELIREYNRQFGVTVLISSHLLSEVEMICDELVMIIDGKLKACGNLQELLSEQRQIRVKTQTIEQCNLFLQQCFNEKRDWIKSAPELDEDGIFFRIPEDADPGLISTELFRAGFALSHFACENQNLEEFFLLKSGGEK